MLSIAERLQGKYAGIVCVGNGGMQSSIESDTISQIDSVAPQLPIDFKRYLALGPEVYKKWEGRGKEWFVDLLYIGIQAGFGD